MNLGAGSDKSNTRSMPAEANHDGKRRDVSRRGFLGLLTATLATPALGCAGYQIGNASLYRPDVRSVHVPIVESDSFRRDLGLRLTEAIVKQIETRTSYLIGSETTADSVLRVRILSDGKRVLGENINDDPRDLQIDLRLDAQWISQSGAPLMQRVNLSIDDNTSFVPEGGQSMATAQQELIDELAQQIVNQMEVAW